MFSHIINNNHTNNGVTGLEFHEALNLSLSTGFIRNFSK